ncbi:MAG: hypothetical protein AAGC78_03850 [Cellvibrio sp.]|uniref:hypothetical protein n=1 Tax=Cellvibrio sp. TaxID=1965322 RepID=UPI00319EC193
MHRKLIRIFACLSLLVCCNSHAAEIPTALQDWQGWVLEKHPDLGCPFLYNDAQRTCVWPSELRIEATTKGAKFTQQIETFSDNWVRLPGSTGFWPENIRDTRNQLNDNNLIVRERAGVPEIFLRAGNYELQGDIPWSSIPRTLAIPPASGLIKLQLNGVTVANPSLESSSELWLASIQNTAETQQQDNLQLRVFRQVIDGVPLRITTRVQLDVSGKERELQLGQLLLNNFTPVSFNSPLPARLEKDGNMRIRVRPGSWEIELQMQSTQPETTLSYKATSDLWPQQEIWVFTPQPALRSLQISGVPSIDPSQTQLPGEWRELPAYLVTPDTSLKLEELQRGTGESSNLLKLEKEIWLDFNGQGFTLRDEISGRLQQGWRLETLPPYDLQSAELDGTPQLVTQLAGSKNSGIEIRNREIELKTISRLTRDTSIPVTGWSTDFAEVATHLHLPPGWSLLTASGASYESGSWVSQWSLWDIFLVLFISVALARLASPLWGGIALLTLLLTFHRSGAPVFIWLNIAVILALLPFVTGRFKTYLSRYTYLSFIVLALLLLTFSVQQARQVFYPQLEFSERNIAENYFEDSWELFAFSSNNKMSEPAASPSVDMAEEVIVTGARTSYTKQQVQQVSQEYDVGQQVQAGPGIPDWNWNNIYLSWSGPVKPDEITKLYLVSPAFNRLGNILSVILPLLLGALLLRLFLQQAGHKIPSLKFGKQIILPAVLIIAGGLTLSDPAQAGVLVSNSLLKELEARLTKPSECLPDCASIESVQLKMEGDKLALDMIIHSADLIALPLPAQRQQWWPNQVLVNNKSASLTQSVSGQLLVNLRKGRNAISLQAVVTGRDNINLTFPLALHNLTSQLQDWQLNGAPTANQASSSLQLQRSESSANQDTVEHLRPDPITPFVTVTRQLQLGLEWRVETRVERVAPAEGIINLEIPLLAGESPIGGDVSIGGDEASKGKISVQLNANQQQIIWQSTLKAESPLTLKAPVNPAWVEVWVLDSSPIWNTQVTGIPAIHADANNNLPVWQPWPDESISIAVSRPEATKGNAVSIDEAKLEYDLGDRASNSTLSLSVRTNQAGYYDFNLPQGARLVGMTINDEEVALQAVNGKIKIPLRPGEQELEIGWQGDEGIGLKTNSPLIQLGNHSSNQSINIDLPSDRWTLLVGGPSMGPAVLLWGMLVIILLLAAVLGRSQLTPLKTHQWVLLSLGVATVNLYVLVLVAAWLIILNRRGTLEQISSRTMFKWMQFGLFSLSLITLLFILGSIPYSLLSNPDMHIIGNGSNAHHLRWYQDQSANEFPQAWIISLPLWSYKLAMLLWSLWLASALTQWIRWSWTQLSRHALWYAPDSILPSTPDTIKNEGAENKTANP